MQMKIANNKCFIRSKVLAFIENNHSLIIHIHESNRRCSSLRKQCSIKLEYESSAQNHWEKGWAYLQMFFQVYMWRDWVQYKYRIQPNRYSFLNGNHLSWDGTWKIFANQSNAVYTFFNIIFKMGYRKTALGWYQAIFLSVCHQHG